MQKEMRKKLVLGLALMAAVVWPGAAGAKKPQYRISFTIKGGRDTVMYMGHYFARGNEVVDTARVDSKGRFLFESEDEALEPGLYFFANPAGTYVEFVVYHEKPFFTFETQNPDWTSNMKVKGSQQNQFFFDFHRVDRAVTDDLDTNSLLMDSVSFDKYRRARLLSLDSVKQTLIDKNPEMFLSKMMVATKDIYPPIVDEKGDSLTLDQRREYYLVHYFDNLLQAPDAIIRTPKRVFYDRVMAYFDQCLKYALPETLIHYTDLYLDRVMSSPKLFQWSLITLTQKYLQSNVMVYDEVYVHLVQKYWASDANTWSTPSSIETELARANKWERLLVGREAPELIMYDTLRVPHSLHSMPNRWKLLIFWSPGCGHCQHIIPEAYKIYLKYRDQYDLGVYSVLSEPDDKTRKEWKEFIAKHEMNSPTWLHIDGGEANVDWHEVYDITSTPQIYLLDENNIIQAKKLSDANLENVIKALCGGEME